MSSLITVGCLLGLLLGIYKSFFTPPSGGVDNQKMSGTFAKMRRYMK